MEQKLQRITDAFQSNLDKTETLLTFDEILQQFCLSALRKAKRGLDSFGNENPRFSIDPTIKSIETIRQNASMKSSYEIMYNQCIVIMVSFFGSALEDIFKEALNEIMGHEDIGELKSEGFKITLEEWQTGEIADIFVQKKDDINFQNMKSTTRSFETYIGLSPIEQDEMIDNINLAQIMRHCIVHSGCNITSKAYNQLKKVKKRSIKVSITKGEYVQFTEKEVHQIKDDMLLFMKSLSSKVLNAVKNN